MAGLTGALKPPSILIVDDEPVIADTLALILNHEGFNAVSAHNGHHGVAKARDIHPDIALIGFVMPDLNGFDAGERIREFSPNTRIIIFNERVPPDYMREMRRRGLEFETRTGPVHPRDLITWLRAIRGEKMVIRKPNLMIVDDDAVITDTLAMILSQHGYPCTTAYDGDEAIEKARWVKPKFILMGVMMPRMNGIEAAKQIKDDQPECDLRLFSGSAATAELLEKARTQGYEFEIAPKPINPQALLEMIWSTGISPESGFARFNSIHQSWSRLGLNPRPIVHELEPDRSIRRELRAKEKTTLLAGPATAAAAKRPGLGGRILHRLLFRPTPITLELNSPAQAFRPKATEAGDETEPIEYTLRYWDGGPVVAVCLNYKRNCKNNLDGTDFLKDSFALRRFPEMEPKRILHAPWFRPDEVEAARDLEICLVRHSELFEAAYAFAAKDGELVLGQSMRESLLWTAGEWSFAKFARQFGA